MTEIRYEPIGTIHTPFRDRANVPIQTIGGVGIKGTIDIKPEYERCLKDLQEFSHIILIYHFHLSKGYSPEVKPFMDDQLRGVFSTRAPKRPNPIGFSVVRLVKIVGRTLHIEDLDIVDGTPLLDIKPYIPKIDAHMVERLGWAENKVERFPNVKADSRFD